MKLQDYLKEDYDEVLREHFCLVECAARVSENLQTGNILTVNRLIRDMTKSSSELHRLQIKKQEYDKMLQLVVDMKAIGINIETVQKRLGGLFE